MTGGDMNHLLHQKLKEWGFRKRATSFYRTTGSGLYLVVAIQGSTWDDSEYLNFGYADSSLAVSGWLPENRCQLRFRLPAVTGVTGDVLALFERERGEPSQAALERLFELMQPLLLVESWDDVKRLIGDRVSPTRIFVHREVRERIAGQEPSP